MTAIGTNFDENLIILPFHENYKEELQGLLENNVIFGEKNKINDCIKKREENEKIIQSLSREGLENIRVEPLPDEFKEDIDHLQKRSYFRGMFNNVNYSINVVDIENIIIPQRQINLSYVKKLQKSLSDKPDMKELIDICLKSKYQEPVQYLPINQQIPQIVNQVPIQMPIQLSIQQPNQNSVQKINQNPNFNKQPAPNQMNFPFPFPQQIIGQNLNGIPVPNLNNQQMPLPRPVPLPTPKNKTIGHIFSSADINLMPLGTTVENVEIDESASDFDGYPVAKIVTYVGYHKAPVNVKRLPGSNRLVLNNGYHRVYALYELGIKKIPMVIQNLNMPEAIMSFDPNYILNSQRPEVVKDFFNESLTEKVKFQKKVKTLSITDNIQVGIFPM